MKIILVDKIGQARAWVNKVKPKIYERFGMRGTLDDDTEFMIVLKQDDWFSGLRGLEITGYENIGYNELTPVQEANMKSLVR